MERWAGQMGQDSRAVPATGGQCDGCGFDYDTVEPRAVATALVQGAIAVADLLRAGSSQLAVRAQPSVWSPLEYGCHLRDVLLVQRERLLLARRVEQPEMVSMGRDERVEHERYGQQDPQDVARQLVDAAGLFANALEGLSDDAWQRTVVYNYPQRSVRSLSWMAQHTLHEVRHHHLDISRQLA